MLKLYNEIGIDHIINRLINKLSPRSRRIIGMRLKGETFEAIAYHHGITRQGAFILYNSAIETIRKQLNFEFRDKSFMEAKKLEFWSILELMGLSRRALEYLKSEQIDQIEKVHRLRYFKIMNQRNMGATTAAELYGFFFNRGIPMSLFYDKK